MNNCPQKWIFAVLGSAAVVACGAFADVSDNHQNGDATLLIEPYAISPGKAGEFVITFLEDPPWHDNPNANNCFVVEFKGDQGIDRPKLEYNGKNVINAIFVASNEAHSGWREISIVVAYQPINSGQQLHSGWGYFYVREKGSPDAGQGGGE